MESYGNWGKEARDVFNRLASLLAFGHSSTKPRLLTEIYSHLNMSLVRSAAQFPFVYSLVSYILIIKNM